MGFTDFTDDVVGRLNKAAARAMTRVGMTVQGEIRKTMKSGGAKSPGKSGHRPRAAPGQPPNVQTSALKQSIDYDVVGTGMSSVVRIGPTGLAKSYGAALELSRDHPHPFIKPVIIDKGPSAGPIFAEEMTRA